jgi:hypothetical protein
LSMDLLRINLSGYSYPLVWGTGVALTGTIIGAQMRVPGAFDALFCFCSPVHLVVVVDIVQSSPCLMCVYGD